MFSSNRPIVKVCCIASPEEARLAISYGASALGLVGRMPSGPGPIEDSLIREIARSIPPPIASFLLTCETRADEIILHHQRTFTNTIQLVDELEDRAYDQFRAQLPSVRIVQVIHVIDESSVDEALEIVPHVDALLLDSGNPKLDIKQLGGTGRVHNWKWSRKIVEQSSIPVFLAGGLNENNVQQAIQEVQPFGLDLCSGVRTEGKLDAHKLEKFMKLVFN
ncbi:MAG: phosphoribosylanthranilate isomerase [Flavisolibacter sp.]